ncbi:hypothetical protein FRC11_014867, partial [Ceratobasidium sp. 423]
PVQPAPPVNMPVEAVEAQPQEFNPHHVPGHLLQNVEVEDGPVIQVVELVHVQAQVTSSLHHSLYGLPLGG